MRHLSSTAPSSGSPSKAACELKAPTQGYAELIRRMGVPEKIARAALHALDRDKGSGFPQKKALWGNRRYWPAVKAYLDRTNGIPKL